MTPEENKNVGLLPLPVDKAKQLVEKFNGKANALFCIDEILQMKYIDLGDIEYFKQVKFAINNQ